MCVTIDIGATGIAQVDPRDARIVLVGRSLLSPAEHQQLAALERRGALSDATRANAALKALNASLGNDERYQSDVFQRRLRELRSQLAEAK